MKETCLSSFYLLYKPSGRTQTLHDRDDKGIILLLFYIYWQKWKKHVLSILSLVQSVRIGMMRVVIYKCTTVTGQSERNMFCHFISSTNRVGTTWTLDHGLMRQVFYHCSTATGYSHSRSHSPQPQHQPQPQPATAIATATATTTATATATGYTHW